METGTIFNIQKFSIHDGPGIRTTVFFKGCPLRCAWCHNPESQSGRAELLYNPEKCVHCLRCVARCPQGCHASTNGQHTLDRTTCAACGACQSPLCEALEIAGVEKSTDEILAEVLKDQLYYQNSGGGITLSGGEPLSQWEACLELLRGAREHGIHTCIETCGFVPRSVLEKTLPLTDLYLFDCKETDPERHRKWTGVDNQLILDNLRYLDSMGKQTVLRCPIIPSINDREEHLAKIAEIANRLQNVLQIVIEPYHTLGVSKYERMGKPYTLSRLETLDRETTERCISILRERTAVPVEKA